MSHPECVLQKNSVQAESVWLLTADYFRCNFKAQQEEMANHAEDIVKMFSLNEEQERAFRIIVNHSSCAALEQLKMYLGGMGGTRKTQVIKALIELFKRKNQLHHFIVLGPTGTAAALLNGSMYHSALGIHMKSNKEAEMVSTSTNLIHDLREKLAGVQYIFLDEVSMVACHKLYAISARL
ncbi:hypothetical protein CPC08DRAFT_651261, partial [Agrocybe pediades]